MVEKLVLICDDDEAVKERLSKFNKAAVLECIEMRRQQQETMASYGMNLCDFVLEANREERIRYQAKQARIKEAGNYLRQKADDDFRRRGRQARGYSTKPRRF